MSGWEVETVEGGVVRRAGVHGGSALWFVHALGDSGSVFLTEADAYLSGEAVAFQTGEAFQDHVLRRVRTLAGDASSGSARAFWRYHANVTLAEPEALLDLGRSARAASAEDGLGTEYRALPIPSLYYWSPANTPVATQEYVRRHALCSRSFRGGHWPMVEDPDTTAHAIASFFEPLIARHRPT